MTATRKSKQPPSATELENRRLRALFEACQALSTSLVLEEIMNLICQGVDKALGLTSVDIYEYSDEHDEIRVVWSFMPHSRRQAAEFVGTTYSLKSHPHFRSAFDSHTVVEYHVDDEEFARRDPKTHREMTEWGEQSVVEVGLLVGTEILGLLSIGSSERPLHLDDEERELLLAFASTAAMAIRNARLYRTIEEQAIKDGLTGLYNHRYFYERFEAELARGRRYGTPVTLLMIDIDDFKMFNDRFGHRAGDDVLRSVARLIKNDVRRDLDIVCRYGGEEFTVILPNTPLAGKEVAKRLCRSIAGSTFAAADGGDLGAVTVSVGVAVYPGPLDSVDRLVNAADQALYVAKGKGKNRVEVSKGAE